MSPSINFSGQVSSLRIPTKFFRAVLEGGKKPKFLRKIFKNPHQNFPPRNLSPAQICWLNPGRVFVRDKLFGFGEKIQLICSSILQELRSEDLPPKKIVENCEKLWKIAGLRNYRSRRMYINKRNADSLFLFSWVKHYLHKMGKNEEKRRQS